MSFDLAASAIGPATGTTAPSTGGSSQVGYNVSLSDLSGFENSMAAAGQRLEAQAVMPDNKIGQTLMQPFEKINTEMKELQDVAKTAQAEGRDMKPSEVVTLTARCQEFSFHCTLISTLASKSSEGLSQMFRQQS